MTRREILREQADILWRVAERSDMPTVRAETRRLAALCERQLADLGGERDRQGTERPKAL